MTSSTDSPEGTVEVATSVTSEVKAEAMRVILLERDYTRFSGVLSTRRAEVFALVRRFLLSAGIKPTFSIPETGEPHRMNIALEPLPPVAEELTPEQKWFDEFEVRFEFLPQLHPGIQWADVERSLKADPELMSKLMAFDAKGHAMNVFGEEKGEFIFVSSWNNYVQVSADHRNLCYDPKGQRLAE